MAEYIERGEAIETIMSEPTEAHYPSWYAEKIKAIPAADVATVRRWIPAAERLPEEKANCIVHYKHAYCDNDGYWAIGICFYDGEKFRIDLSYKVTHWMPLPKPPKGAYK